VLVPRGHRYLIGTLALRGNIDFHLEGELVISTNPADYRGDGVITAWNAENLHITGNGSIAGRSLSFMTGYERQTSVAVQGMAAQAVHPHGCTNLQIRDITFATRRFGVAHAGL